MVKPRRFIFTQDNRIIYDHFNFNNYVSNTIENATQLKHFWRKKNIMEICYRKKILPMYGSLV